MESRMAIPTTIWSRPMYTQNTTMSMATAMPAMIDAPNPSQDDPVQLATTNPP